MPSHQDFPLQTFIVLFGLLYYLRLSNWPRRTAAELEGARGPEFSYVITAAFQI